MSANNFTIPLREFPQSIAAEAAVLGSIIIDPACFTEARRPAREWKYRAGCGRRAAAASRGLLP